MPIISYDDSDATCRFKILVNGFADGRCFATLRDAQAAVAAYQADDCSFEIYDSYAKRYVWTRQRREGDAPARSH